MRRHQQIPTFNRGVDRQALLTMADAAIRLGVSPTTVRRLITRGVLPATQPMRDAPWGHSA
jgi:excisionase family DNA binding protein